MSTDGHNPHNPPNSGDQGWDQNQPAQDQGQNWDQNQNWDQGNNQSWDQGNNQSWDQNQGQAWDQGNNQAWDQSQGQGYGAGAPGYGAGAPGYGAPQLAPGEVPGPGGLPLAKWPKRALGALIDIVVPMFVISMLWTLLFDRDSLSTTDTSNSFQFNWSGSVIPNLVAWALIGLIAAATAQKTGQTIGRKMAKTQLLTEAGAVPSFGVIFARSLLHILDNLVCCLGFLFPLWDKQRQTFADKIMKTYVVDVERTGPINTQP